MNRCIRSTVLAAALMSLSLAVAAAELTCTLPTSKVNGEPIAAGELTALTFYADGEKLATVDPGECRFVVPSCTARTYHVTASIGDFESDASNTATTVPVASACRPLAPSGLGIAASQ